MAWQGIKISTKADIDGQLADLRGIYNAAQTLRSAFKDWRKVAKAAYEIESIIAGEYRFALKPQYFRILNALFHLKNHAQEAKGGDPGTYAAAYRRLIANIERAMDEVEG